MAGDEKKPSSPQGKGSSPSPPESQPIPEQNFTRIKNLDEIEKWHKEQRRQVEKISDALQLELNETLEHLQKEDGGYAEEQLSSREGNDEAPPSLEESMSCFLEQMEIRRQRVNEMKVLLRRQSKILDEAEGDGGQNSDAIKKKVENAKRWVAEIMSYLPVLLAVMERRFILQAEVESLEPPVYGGLDIGQFTDYEPPENKEFTTITNVDEIEKRHKEQRRQVEKMSDALRLELGETQKHIQKEDGTGEEELSVREGDDEAPLPLKESMRCFLEQMEIRRQRVDEMKVLLRRQSKILNGAKGAGLDVSEGVKKRVENAKRWAAESMSYLPVLLCVIERRFILRAEVESLEPPVHDGLDIGQSVADAPPVFDGLEFEIPTDVLTADTSSQVEIPTDELVADTSSHVEIPTDVLVSGSSSQIETPTDVINSSDVTVQETEDVLASIYETSLSFLSEQPSVENLEILEDWYTEERRQVFILQLSLFNMIRYAQALNEQECGGSDEQNEPQDHDFQGDEFPVLDPTGQDMENCLKMMKEMQQFLQGQWSQIYEFLREHYKTEALIDEVLQEQSITDPPESVGTERAARAKRWMKEHKSYFQLLILTMLRRYLLKAELELLELPVDDDGAPKPDGSRRGKRKKKKGRRRRH